METSTRRSRSSSVNRAALAPLAKSSALKVKQNSVGSMNRALENTRVNASALKQSGSRAIGGVSKKVQNAFSDVTNKSINAGRAASSMKGNLVSNAAAAVLGSIKPDTTIQSLDNGVQKRAVLASRQHSNTAVNQKSSAAVKILRSKTADNNVPSDTKMVVKKPLEKVSTLPGTIAAVPRSESAVSNLTAFVHPFDLHDRENHLMAAEYSAEIFSYMRAMETKLLPSSDYIEKHPGMSWAVRTAVVDWLINFHLKFNVAPETLFLAVNLFDRYMTITARKVEVTNKIKKIGLASFLIAAKYEDQTAPSVAQLVFQTPENQHETAVLIAEVLRYERLILTTLQFELGSPAPTHFLRRISKAENYNMETRTIAKFFLELMLCSELFLSVKPSLQAAAGIWLARRMTNQEEWNADLEYFSGYKNSTVMNVAQEVIWLLMAMPPQQRPKALFEKFADERYYSASSFVCRWLAENRSLLEPVPQNHILRVRFAHCK